MNNSNWNENKIKFLTRNKKRASLVPAAGKMNLEKWEKCN